MNRPELSSDLRTAVLELGLEDRIPVPEATQTAQQLVGDENAIPRLRNVLEELLTEGRIRICRGDWQNEDPDEITPEEARTLLGDPKWYVFRIDDHDEERLSYVNVENIRDA